MATFNISSAANVNNTQVKAAAADIYSVTAFNAGAGVAFLKLYNKGTVPVAGTDVPFLVQQLAAGASAHWHFEQPMRLKSGLGIAITGAAADSDTTAVAAAQVKATIVYD